DRFADTNRLDVFYTAAEGLDVLRFAPRGAFAERAVRKAVELSVDRQGIVDDIFAGRARVPRTYLVPPLWASAESGPIARVDREAVVAKGDFDLAVLPEVVDDPMRATERWTGLVEPWFDVLALSARRASGRDEERALYAELQRIWSDDLPALPLYQRLRVDVAARALSGVQPPPHDGALTWNVATWRYSAP